ncbi:MAG: YdeI/OmpD-associated family protein [Phycisphaerales bacterium]
MAKQSPRPTTKTATAKIRFSAQLLRPKPDANTPRATWTFLTLPKQAASKLPSRGMVSISGTFNTVPFTATLQPDGNGGHWLKVDPKLSKRAAAAPGDEVSLEITPLTPDQEPEPEVPADFRKALAAAPKSAQQAWKDITPVARRDWIQFMTSGKRAETRTLRIEKACDMLASGKRRPCCFDRSGMYDKSLSCPIADND